MFTQMIASNYAEELMVESRGPRSDKDDAKPAAEFIEKKKKIHACF